MQESYVTNNYLRAVLNELNDFLERGQEPPEDLFMDFIAELKVSTLLIPGIIDGDELISENITSNEDGSTVIPLYTDDEEFIKDKGLESEYDPIPNDIGFYVDSVNEHDYVGIVINLPSECFFVPIELLNDLPLNQGISIQDNFKGYGPDKLMPIAENAPNDSIVSFIRNPSNQDNVEGLMLELSKSILLDVIVSDEDFADYETDGFISLEDVENWEVCTTGDDENVYGILFTSKDAITSTMDADSEYYYAYQITVLSEFIDYVLREDADGIVINPGLDDYLIPRSALFAYSSILDNPSFKQAIDYAFLL